MILRGIILIAISFIAGASIGRNVCGMIEKWRAKCGHGGAGGPKIKKVYKNNVIVFPMDRINKDRIKNAGSN